MKRQVLIHKHYNHEIAFFSHAFTQLTNYVHACKQIELR